MKDSDAFLPHADAYEEDDGFSYDVVDESLDDLKHDLVVLDDSIQNSLTTRYNKPNSSELALRKLYEEYSTKLGIKVGYDDFKDYVSHITENNKLQRELIDAINAKIAMDVTQRTTASLLQTFQTLVNRAQTMILKESAQPDQTLSPELVGMIDKCMQWNQQLQEISEETRSKVADPDKTIERTVEKINATMNKQKAIEEKNERTGLTTQQFNDVLERLKAEYNN